MDLGIALAIALVGVGIVALRRLAQRATTRRAYRQVAKTLGLEAVALEVGLFGTPRLAGVVRGFTLVVAEETVGLRRVTRISAWHQGAIPPGLEVRAETVRSRLDAALGERDVRTGDDEFDDAVLIRGDEQVIVSIFTAAARAEAQRLVRAGVRVHRGRVEREVVGRAVPVDRLLPAAQEVLALALLVVAPSHPAGRLVANAHKDPRPAVRRRNLELLAKRHAGAPETATAMRRALEDPDESLRLWTASRLGEDGVATLVELATGERVGEATARAAIETLGPRLPVADGWRALRAAESGGRARAAVAAAHALARAGAAGAMDHLVAALTGDSAARLAAVAALAEVGTVAAVPALHAAVAAHPLDLGLRGNAAGAIAAIQERAAGAAPGQLAIADDEAGALALADGGDDGALALADPPAPGDRRGR